MPIDYKNYPPNWKTEIVPRILKRAGNKCERCGLNNGFNVYSYRIFIRANGKYKLKRFWLETYGDWYRVKPYAYQEECKLVKVVLTVAHLDHDEGNQNVIDARLMAMCQYCHLDYDVLEKQERKKK